MDKTTGEKQTSRHSTKVLNVVIPESAYWQLRKCATESQMSMKEFMAEFCKTATPIFIEPVTSDLTAQR